MLVIQNSSGQLGNKLLITSHVIAYCLSSDEILINFILLDDAKYFSPHGFFKKKILLPRSKILQKSFNFFLEVVNKITMVCYKSQFYDKQQVGWIHTEIRSIKRRTNTILLLEGEGFRGTVDVNLHYKSLKNIFRLKKKYQKQVSQQLEKYQDADFLLIGIHIRRGDYRNWAGGVYFYKDYVYKEAIEQFNNLPSLKNKKKKFILFSDELIEKENFKNYKTIISSNTMIVDLYLLAECNYIIGPPSTFSGWASFFGNVPLYVLESEKFVMTLDQFKIFQL